MPHNLEIFAPQLTIVFLIEHSNNVQNFVLINQPLPAKMRLCANSASPKIGNFDVIKWAFLKIYCGSLIRSREKSVYSNRTPSNFWQKPKRWEMNKKSYFANYKTHKSMHSSIAKRMKFFLKFRKREKTTDSTGLIHVFVGFGIQ